MVKLVLGQTKIIKRKVLSMYARMTVATRD